MGKKVLVDREWYKKALKLMTDSDDEYKRDAAFISGLQSFLLTVLTPEQQNKLEKEIEGFIERYEEVHGK